MGSMITGDQRAERRVAVRADGLPSLTALQDLTESIVDAVVSIPPRDPSSVGPDDLRRLFDPDHPLHAAGPRSPVAWRACARVLKPGGHVLVAALGNDMDIIGMALRLTGFDLRDAILVETENWHGPILLARRELATKSLIENIMRHGAGALNIDAARIKPSEDEVILGTAEPEGRWPTNFVHDGSAALEEALRERRGQPSKAMFFNSLAVDADADGLAMALARHLIGLAVPPGGVVLDPFAATDVVGRAAASHGVRAVLVDYRTRCGGRAAESSPGG